MDLSFTHDPKWIANREQQWLSILDELQDFSKKEMALYKEYFFTGVVPKGLKLGGATLMESFPVLSQEGMSYCLQTNLDSDLSDDNIESLQREFVIYTGLLEELPIDEKVRLFTFVFGERYSKSRMFPFFIGADQVEYPVVVTPLYIFAVSVRRCIRFLKGKEALINFYMYIPEYLVSLCSEVDSLLFSIAEPDLVSNSDMVNYIHLNSFIKKLIGFCVRPDSCVVDSEFAEPVEKFISVFNGFALGEEAPSELKKLYSHIQLEGSE